jgi:hypothetical protein
MTPEEKTSVKTYLKETNDYQVLSDRVARLGKLEKDALLRNNDFLEEIDCHMKRDELNKGGPFERHPDLLKYITFNAASAAGGFGLIYGLAFLLPALVRRYGKWLNA